MRSDKDANQTIQLKRRDTLAFNNSKEIKQRWCKGKQFQSNNSTLPCILEIWSRGCNFLWLWLWIEIGIIVHQGIGQWWGTQNKPMCNNWNKSHIKVKPTCHIYWKPWIRWQRKVHNVIKDNLTRYMICIHRDRQLMTIPNHNHHYESPSNLTKPNHKCILYGPLSFL